MSRIRTLLLSASLLGLSSGMAMGAEMNVVASIKPVHALVAGVMKGVGTPELIVEGAASPHSYSLKPSQAAALQEARLVFWIGHDLETFLDKPLDTIAKDGVSVSLFEAPGVTHLAFRENAGEDAHAHDEKTDRTDGDHAHEDHHDHDHDDHDHDGHDHGAEHDHGTDEAHEDHAADDHGHGHAHGAEDPHVWLDPDNAKAMTRHIAATLAQADPENAERYRENAADLTARIDLMSQEIADTLAPVRDKRYVVFHDAYQYFEKRFGLSSAGAITVSPEAKPSAARIAEIQHRIEDTGAVCVFSEPQFDPKLVTVAIEGTAARKGSLDPLGNTLADSGTSYLDLMRGMAKEFKDCLSSAD
ncbi:zinc ABC transporter substrate-binding protein [Stappia sp. ES.058]|uniref:zinc ABC transporter substrate-binding protein n=1 Tax=Stappia sp. ES.058 TaxID=1881061 RepID=UPI00087C73F6|nr:zinc ABC transporter substrate-binding protein [Stappia sp. ES.058]SDU03767.1 zinc transport system substrate-binding protein [Stappia sp. ES.058]